MNRREQQQQDVVNSDGVSTTDKACICMKLNEYYFTWPTGYVLIAVHYTSIV